MSESEQLHQAITIAQQAIQKAGERVQLELELSMLRKRLVMVEKVSLIQKIEVQSQIKAMEKLLAEWPKDISLPPDACPPERSFSEETSFPETDSTDTLTVGPPEAITASLNPWDADVSIPDEGLQPVSSIQDVLLEASEFVLSEPAEGFSEAEDWKEVLEEVFSSSFDVTQESETEIFELSLPEALLNEEILDETSLPEDSNPLSTEALPFQKGYNQLTLFESV
ncbi:MAG: hypothetical protein K2X66_12990 [Cyanobacteria bacterium]|nr:hypothetical protein [Cyanobacteriota bacterium]